jgi:DNA-binding LacI/PurR family transcriptional regulator
VPVDDATSPVPLAAQPLAGDASPDAPAGSSRPSTDPLSAVSSAPSAPLGSASSRVRGPSMADVAKRAGVSSQTVSRVSNGHQNVDADTRDRVLAAMAAVGYRPNSAARALKTGRFRTIGVIMFTLSTFGNMRTLDAIATATAEAGYSITLMPLSHPTQGEVAGAFTRLSEQAVDGILIIIEAHILDRADISLPAGIPVVIVDSDAADPYTVVDTDQRQGARLATEHLLALGHPTVHHVAGPPTSFSSARRTEAWRASLEAVGAPVDEPLVGDWSAESGYRIGAQLAQNPAVTAIFAANDQMALGVLRALHEAGRPVPDDVSVVGFDDTEESSSYWPPLTTVHQDFSAVGRICVQRLLAEIEQNAAAAGTTIVPVRLVERASTAPYARDNVATPSHCTA